MGRTHHLTNQYIEEKSGITASPRQTQIAQPQVAQILNSLPPASTRLVATVQGTYYLFTGIWPLIHMPSFEKVTGPKSDNWLVRTVGVLVTVIGAVLCLAAVRQRPLEEPEVPTLAVGSAVGLTAIEVIYVARGRISPIYLLDALLEIILIAAWALALNKPVSTPTQ